MKSVEKLIREFLLKEFGYEENILVTKLADIMNNKCLENYNDGYDDGYSNGYDDGENSEH